MKRLTVYTPTYNRAYTLQQGYDALCRQSCQDFQWIIVDDGSTDGTRELVDGWIAEGRIPIEYYYQENAGVNVARNLAIEKTQTELNVCVDSDDYLTDEAVEVLLQTWDARPNGPYCGVIGYDVLTSGELACDTFPDGLQEATLCELYEKHHSMGDKKMMYRTDLAKKYPSPIFPGEKYYPNRQKYYLIENEGGPLLLLRRPLCVVEYLPDGITASTFQRYRNNPKGLAAYRLFLMKNNPAIKNQVRQTIHYIAMNIFDKNGIGLKTTPHKALTVLLSPVGFALHLYIMWKTK